MKKKRLFHFLIFILVIIFIDLLVGKSLEYLYFKEVSGLHYRTTFSMDSTKADIIIFGSSRANHHYVPKVFEDSMQMSIYNAGRDGQGIYYHLAILEMVLERYTPKVVILDYYDVLRENPFEYERLVSLLPYYNKHPKLSEIIEKRSKYERVKLILHTYAYNSQPLTIIAGNMNFNKKRKNDNQGYIALNNVWKEKLNSNHLIKNFQLDTNKMEAFEKFILKAKYSGARVYIVFSPIFQKDYQSIDNDLGKNICDSLNISFFDFSKDTMYLNESKLFHDIVHLNHAGATHFSLEFVKMIKKQD
jgi:hypothetical protein